MCLQDEKDITVMVIGMGIIMKNLIKDFYQKYLGSYSSEYVGIV